MQNYKYEAFISYRHVEPDMQIAKTLHRQLESYSIPAAIKKSSGKSKVGTIFRDQDELPTSTDLGTGIHKALEESNWLIVICSRVLPLSKWCLEEINTFISLGKGDRILTLLIDGEPLESFPNQLRFTEINGQRIEIEPLAADIRATNLNKMLKKLKIEKLRLLAPMLGVKFDDLRQRAKERRRKRFAFIASCALVATAILGSIYMIQYQKAQQALHEVSITKAAELMSEAQNYYYNGQQASAVRAAAECVSLQTSLGLDTLSAQSVLYSSIVNFPEKSSFARLAHAGVVSESQFSPDGTILATISNSNFLTVWNVHTAEVVYSKQLPDLPEFIGGDIYCLKFTKSNELILSMPVQQSQNLKKNLNVYKFDRKGNELFSYASPDLYSSDHTGMYVWDDAGVIVLDASGGYCTLDLNNGSLISEKSMSDYAWCESDSDTGKYYTLTYFTVTSDTCNLTLDVLTAESVRAGEVYKSYSFSVPLDEIDCMIPLDDENIVIANKNEIYLYSISSKERKTIGKFSNMNMKYPILMTCSEPYHFVAGYQDYAISGFEYDPTTGRITPTNDFTWGSNPDNLADYVVWADKDASILSFLLKSKGNYGNFGNLVLSDGAYWYRDNVTDMQGVANWVSSENGTIAATEKNSNLCYLYNVAVESDHYYQNDRDIQHIRQPMYLDSKSNFIVYQGFEEGKGYYFSIGSIKEGAYTEDKRAYIPGTETYGENDMFDVQAPYDQVLYGENEAVLLVSEGNDKWSLLLLDYGSCTFKKLNQLEGYPDLVTINNEIVVVSESSDSTALAYDLKTGELVNSVPKGALFVSRVVHCGRPASNIAFCKWMGQDLKQLHWGYVNFDTGEFIKLQDTTPFTGGSTAFISEDGHTAYLYGFGMDIAIFDLRSNKITGYMKNKNYINVQYAGGNILAMVDDQNLVSFFDMGAGKELAVYSGFTDSIRSITYNANNGLAMIMGNTTLEVYDVKKNCRYTGAILFADNLSKESTYTAYITDDARYFYLVRLEEISEHETGLWYYCVPHTYHLYNTKELLQLAQEYGYKQ